MSKVPAFKVQDWMTNDWTGTKFVKGSPYGSKSSLVQRKRAAKKHHNSRHFVRHGLPNEENFL